MEEVARTRLRLVIGFGIARVSTRHTDERGDRPDSLAVNRAARNQ
jgi:hypothetical protein